MRGDLAASNQEDNIVSDLRALELHAKAYKQTIFGHIDRLTMKYGPNIGYAFCLQALDELISLQDSLDEIPEVKVEISSAIEDLAVRSSELFLQACGKKNRHVGSVIRLH